MTNQAIAVIADDGIGQEVVPAAIDCVNAALARHDRSLEWTYLEWGSEFYLRHGSMMPPRGYRL